MQWHDLAARLTAALEAAEPAPLEGVNVYAVPPEQLTAPALVISPDEPWRAVDLDEPFTRLRERYLVLAVAGASNAAGAFDTLYQLIRAAEAAEGGRFAWVSSSAPIGVSSGGVTYLGASVRMTYSAED